MIIQQKNNRGGVYGLLIPVVIVFLIFCGEELRSIGYIQHGRKVIGQ